MLLHPNDTYRQSTTKALVTNMNNLTVFKQDDLEVIINTDTGESFCSVSGYARMSGFSQQAISKRVKKLDNSDLIQEAELDTGYGVKLHKLLTEDLISDWIVDDNPRLAKTLLKGGVRLFLHKAAGYNVSSTATPVEQPKPPQLSPIDKVNQLGQTLQAFGIDLQNPRWKQALQDVVLNTLGVNQPALPQSDERWLGVVELAEEMGYSQAKQLGHRTSLGRYVSTHGEDILERTQEKRLCNGTQRYCWVYKDCEQLRDLIEDYFAA